MTVAGWVRSPSGSPTIWFPVITETAIGKRPALTVYGDDYPTRDGSCLRDYIHVMDIASAHTKALQYLLENKQKERWRSSTWAAEKASPY